MAIEKTIDINVNSKQAQKGLNDLEKSIDGVNKEVKETNASTQAMSGTLNKATGGALAGFQALKGGLRGVIASLKTLRGAVIATGIGALLIAVTSLTQAFSRSEEGQNKLSKVLGILGSVVDNVLDGFANLGEGIISAFENPQQAWDNFTESLNNGWQFIKNQIINRFQGGWAVLSGRVQSGILKMRIAWNEFTGDAEEAETLKAELEEVNQKVVDGVKQIAKANKAVVEVYESAKDKIKEFTNEVIADAKAAAAIADQRAAADKIARNLIIERAEAERKIAELREKAVNKDKFTAAERIKFLEEAGKVSDELAAKEIQVAKIRLEAKRAENALAKSTKEDLDEQARLEAEVIQKETQRLNLQKRLSTELLTSRREEAKAQQDLINEENKRNEEAAAKEQTRLDAIQKIRNDFADKQKQKEAETELEKIALEEEKKIAELDKLNATEQEKFEVYQYYAGLRTEVEEKENEKKAQIEELRKKQMLGDAKNTFDQVAQLAGKDSKIGKAMAIASATISGIEGVQNAYSTAQKSPITAVFPAYPIVQAGLAAAVSAKNIAAIKSMDSSGKGQTSVPNVSDGGGSQAPNFNIVGATETSQLADAIGGQEQQPVQAYVVANDVTTAQSLNNNIVEGATL
jgi:hypothetical protein